MNFRRKGDVIKASMGGKKKAPAGSDNWRRCNLYFSFFLLLPSLFFFPKIVKKRGGESRVSLSHHLRLFFHFRSTSVPATAPFFFSFFLFLSILKYICVFFFPLFPFK